MLSLLLAFGLAVPPQQDVLTTELLAMCDPEPTEQCYVYFRGFLDSLLAHEWAGQEMKSRDSRVVVPRLACIPAGIDVDRVRVEVVKAWKAKPVKEPGPSWALATIGRLYPCAKH